MKSLIITAAILFLMIFLYGESRKFFCLADGKCITVWKTYNDVCYVIEGKYYGLIKPSHYSYIKTTNSNILDVIWNSYTDTLIVNSSNSNSVVLNNSTKGVKFVKYNLNKKTNDSLLTIFDGNYNRYKKGVKYINIFVKENYATDNNGNKLLKLNSLFGAVSKGAAPSF